MTDKTEFYDLEEIKIALAGRIDEFILHFFPEAKRHSQCYKLGDINGDKGDSFMISTRENNPGYYKDFADPTVCGKPWRLAAIKLNVSLREGIVWLANFLNIQPIQSFGNINIAKDPEKLARELRPLSAKSLAYATKRGITEDTLRKYGVASGVHDDTIFPYYDIHNKLGMVKHWGHVPKPDGRKTTWTNDNPVMSLFGKDVCDPETGLQKLVITEGEWDAMSCFQLGIPAVSIPMGVNNHSWIADDYHYLSHFDEIVLLFDNDAPGKKAADEVAGRLGRERCMIVTLPLKDANDMLKAGRGSEIDLIIKTTVKDPIAEIVEPSSMKDEVRSYMRNDHLVEGDAFFLPGFNIAFRKHEITLWYGLSFHGKSVCLQNQIGSLAVRGESSCVASFEQLPPMTFSQILASVVARPNLPYEPDFDAAFDWMSELVFMYKSMDRATPKHLISTFKHAHKRYGVKTFVVDNIMTMAIDRGDNTDQANAMDKFRMFIAEVPGHLHIVAHPRKPPANTTTPPTMGDIRGASEFGDIPHNIILVWRDMAKAERIAEMEDGNYTTDEIDAFWASTPDGKLVVRKQRTTGETPMINFWFDKITKRFMTKAGHPLPMFSECPWSKD
jgi:twinkle protein